MLIKIVLGGAIFLGTVFFDRKYLMPKGIIVPDLIFCGWLFGVYLTLLYLEIRSRIRSTSSLKQLRWAGFHFSFWAGLFSGLFIASPESHSWFSDPLNFIGLLGGLISMGVISGLLGMAITQFMLLLIFKLPDID